MSTSTKYPFPYVSKTLQVPEDFWQAVTVLESGREALVGQFHSALKTLGSLLSPIDNPPSLFDGETLPVLVNSIGGMEAGFGRDTSTGRYRVYEQELSKCREAVRLVDGVFSGLTMDQKSAWLKQFDDVKLRGSLMDGLSVLKRSSKGLVENLNSIDALLSKYPGVVVKATDGTEGTLRSTRSRRVTDNQQTSDSDEDSERSIDAPQLLLGRDERFWDLYMGNMENWSNAAAKLNKTHDDWESLFCHEAASDATDKAMSAALQEVRRTLYEKATPLLNFELATRGGRFEVPRTEFDAIHDQAQSLPGRLEILAENLDMLVGTAEFKSSFGQALKQTGKGIEEAYDAWKKFQNGTTHKQVDALPGKLEALAKDMSLGDGVAETEEDLSAEFASTAEAVANTCKTWEEFLSDPVHEQGGILPGRLGNVAETIAPPKSDSEEKKIFKDDLTATAEAMTSLYSAWDKFLDDPFHGQAGTLSGRLDDLAKTLNVSECDTAARKAVHEGLTSAAATMAESHQAWQTFLQNSTFERILDLPQGIATVVDDLNLCASKIRLKKTMSTDVISAARELAQSYQAWEVLLSDHEGFDEATTA